MKKLSILLSTIALSACTRFEAFSNSRGIPVKTYDNEKSKIMKIERRNEDLRCGLRNLILPNNSEKYEKYEKARDLMLADPISFLKANEYLKTNEQECYERARRDYSSKAGEQRYADLQRPTPQLISAHLQLTERN